jgi:hypothetical protein
MELFLHSSRSPCITGLGLSGLGLSFGGLAALVLHAAGLSDWPLSRLPCCLLFALLQANKHSLSLHTFSSSYSCFMLLMDVSPFIKLSVFTGFFQASAQMPPEAYVAM